MNMAVKSVPAVDSFVSRQVPFEKFKAEHQREREQLAALHARESGCDLAAALVGRRQSLESLSADAKRRCLKAYAVPENLSGEFFKACKEAIPFETAYQLNCV